MNSLVERRIFEMQKIVFEKPLLNLKNQYLTKEKGHECTHYIDTRFSRFAMDLSQKQKASKARLALGSSRKIASQLEDNVQGIYSAIAEYFQKRELYVEAFEHHRKAVDWCQHEGVPNSRSCKQLANFLLENSIKLSTATHLERSFYLEEAEKTLGGILLRGRRPLRKLPPKYL